MILTEARLKNIVASCTRTVLKEIYKEQSSESLTRLCNLYSGWDDNQLDDFVNEQDKNIFSFEPCGEGEYVVSVDESLFSEEKAKEFFTEIARNNFEAFDFYNREYDEMYERINRSMGNSSAEDDLDAYYDEFDNWCMDLGD